MVIVFRMTAGLLLRMPRECHSECSEESRKNEILRSAQNDSWVIAAGDIG
jgi:hypothetical protein